MIAYMLHAGALNREIADVLFLPVDRDWSGDELDALELAGILAARGWDVSVSAAMDVGGSVRWRVAVTHTLDFAGGDATADTMPLALCTAVLKAHAGVGR